MPLRPRSPGANVSARPDAVLADSAYCQVRRRRTWTDLHVLCQLIISCGSSLSGGSVFIDAICCCPALFLLSLCCRLHVGRDNDGDEGEASYYPRARQEAAQPPARSAAWETRSATTEPDLPNERYLIELSSLYVWERGTNGRCQANYRSTTRQQLFYHGKKGRLARGGPAVFMRTSALLLLRRGSFLQEGRGFIHTHAHMRSHTHTHTQEEETWLASPQCFSMVQSS